MKKKLSFKKISFYSKLIIYRKIIDSLPLNLEIISLKIQNIYFNETTRKYLSVFLQKHSKIEEIILENCKLDNSSKNKKILKISLIVFLYLSL